MNYKVALMDQLYMV